MRKLSLALLLATAMSLVFASLALAQNSQTYSAELGELNGSGASGTATFTVEGNQATVEIETIGSGSASVRRTFA